MVDHCVPGTQGWLGRGKGLSASGLGYPAQEKVGLVYCRTCVLHKEVPDLQVL